MKSVTALFQELVKLHHDAKDSPEDGIGPSELKRLNPPITHDQLRKIEALAGHVHLPADYVSLLHLHNGSHAAHAGDAFHIEQWSFMSADNIAQAYRHLKEDEHPDGKPKHVVGVQEVYQNPLWIPIFCHEDWKYFICLDFDPASGGKQGQVIEISRHGPTGRWDSFSAFFEQAVTNDIKNLQETLDEQADDPDEEEEQPNQKKKPGWFGW